MARLGNEYILYNFDSLGLQTFDTVEVFGEKGKSWKGFFLKFNIITHGENFKILGFKAVNIFSNNCFFLISAEEDIITRTKFDIKHLRVFHTRMVLTEKLKFEGEYEVQRR